ncbi:MAG: glutamate-cysteine ligase family protein [Candidatus Sigynarchaeota archaeon]
MNIPSTPFPQPIGNEMELQIVNDAGAILRGEELIKIWNAIFDKIELSFKQALGMAPEYIRKRVGAIKRVTKEKSGKQLPYLDIEYKTFKTFHVSAIGPDPNISQVTWLMELVTPPASTMEEFAWWNSLLNTALVKSLPPGYWILPLGLNPAEKEYSSGVTFGEHYHVGVDDPGLKLAIYTLIRDFIPHLIALTVNSPFINKKPTGVVKVTDDGNGLQILGKDCTKSLRLFYNKAQMGPVDKETYIPCLKALDKDAFCDVIRRKPPDDRFVDMYPFTPYGTIELRVFDTQFALSRRLAIVALIEALCLKAKRLLERGESIPCVLSSVLIANREKAVLFGLHGKFTPDTTLPGSFGMTYNEDPATGKQNGKLFQAVNSMLFFLKKEIADLGFKEILLPIQISIEGNNKIRAPVTPSDYLLYLSEKQGGDIENALHCFKQLQATYCIGSPNTLEDPLVVEWGKPGNGISQSPTHRSVIMAEAVPAPASTEIDFTGIAATATESQVKVVKPIPFQLSFTIASSLPRNSVDILAIQQLIEIQKKAEIVLATSFKRFAAPVNQQVTISQDEFPLVPAQDLFIGNKQCRLKFSLKDKQKEATTYSNAFWIELLPRYVITSEFRKRKVSPGEKLDVKYKITSTSSTAPLSAIQVDVKFQVLSADGTTVLYQTDQHASVKDTETVQFKVIPLASWKDRELSFRVVAMLKDKIIARHEIGQIILDIPEEMPDTFTPRLVEKKAEIKPRSTEPAVQSSAPATGDKYGLVRTLAFSSAPEKQEPSTMPVKMPARGQRELKIPPSQLKRHVAEPLRIINVPETISAPKVKSSKDIKPLVSTSTPALDEKAERERMANLLARETTSKPRVDASSLKVPFLEAVDAASAKVEIDVKLLSPRLVAPGEKIVIAYTMKKTKTIGENEFLKLISFLMNIRQEFIVVLNEKYKFQGDTSNFTLTVDPQKHFKDWKPTEPFHAVLQAYLDNTLVGQAVYSDFQLAKFTTSSQITWKKIDLLSGTIYPGMDAGFEFDLDVKSIVNPVAIAIEASCQGTIVTTDFMVKKEGTNHFIAPFRVPFQGLITVPSTPMIIKIKDSSGMTIKEQKKTIAIIARGPVFVIKDVVLDTMEGLDNATLTFEFINDGKLPVSCDVTALAIEPGGSSHEIASRKLKLKGMEMQHVECTKVRLPINAIRDNTIIIDFLIEIADFNKIKNLIRQHVKLDPAPGEKVNVYFHGKLKNIDRVRDITAYIDKVGIEIEVRKEITLGGCKAKVVEIVDGEARKVIHVVKLPKGRERVHENITWRPPRAKTFPSLCKLEVQFFQDDDQVEIDRMRTEPLFFTIFPE